MSHRDRDPLLGVDLAGAVAAHPTSTENVTLDNDNRRVRRVLVVDDSEDVTELLAFMIQDLGYEVRAANSGADALAVAARFQPDVVMLDLTMPGLDGFAVAETMRTMPACSEALLVAVSGASHTDLRDRTIAAGFDCCYTKPITLAQVRELFGQRERALAPQ